MSPCDQCPFRADITPFLSGAERVRELERHQDGEFPCHQTTELGDDDELLNREKTVACAGRMVMSWKSQGGLGTIDAMSARCKMFDPVDLDLDAHVFENWDAMAEAMER